MPPAPTAIDHPIDQRLLAKRRTSRYNLHTIMSMIEHDVLIVGAGPAGATAASLLTQDKRSIALLDRAEFPLQGSVMGWLNSRSATLLEQIGIPMSNLPGLPFQDVTFYNEDFSKQASPSFEQTPGYLIDRIQFRNLLVQHAVDRGVELIQKATVLDFEPQESEVIVTLETNEPISGRLLMLAGGRATPLIQRMGLSPPRRFATIWTGQIDIGLEKGQGTAKPKVAVVLGLDKSGSFAMCATTEQRQAVAINWFGDREQATPTLQAVCHRLAQHHVAPVDVSEVARGVQVVPSPASAALDMDSHVGKHSLLIGDAGGFISAASNEGIYPAMWSAQIAAEVIDAALKSPQSQDELLAFESKWRTTMAEYLRPPNTDVQFLLPLIFSNQPMADRMGAAFFFGENI